MDSARTMHESFQRNVVFSRKSAFLPFSSPCELPLTQISLCEVLHWKVPYCRITLLRLIVTEAAER